MDKGLIQEINEEFKSIGSKDNAKFKASCEDESIDLINITKNGKPYMKLIIDYQMRNCTCCTEIQDKYTERVAKSILKVLENRMKNSFS